MCSNRRLMRAASGQLRTSNQNPRGNPTAPPPELRLSTLGIQAAALGSAEESLRPTFTGAISLVG